MKPNLAKCDLLTKNKEMLLVILTRPANDLSPQMIPVPQMIPKLDRK